MGAPTDQVPAGLKVGLEIHQQLDTPKLFCSCPSELHEDVVVEVLRRLRPVQSELGEVDLASVAEAKKERSYVYQNVPTSCLVEIDEEPPHGLDPQALELTLVVAKTVGARIVDEIHVMRKIVVDGSNTAGFQRTALVALDGMIPTASGPVGIASICLEEDSARKIEERPGAVVYRLDRLGIPLIEMATDPVIHSPEQAKEVALAIGMLLRSTKRVKRGLGTIRQDLNVSITGGTRVEIKGVQDLRSIPVVIANEARRQQELLGLRDELARRGLSAKSLGGESVDVTEHLSGSGSKLLQGALAAGGRVVALRLPSFGGLLKSDRFRFGKELAGYAKSVGLKGILHTDELPAYGITDEEVRRIRTATQAAMDDAVVLAAGPKDVAARAIALLRERALTALDGVPGVVRHALPDGSSEFLRPMPGAARMYPETDLPPLPIARDVLAKLPIPESFASTVARFRTTFGISDEQATQLVHGGWADVFESVAGDADTPAAAATALTSTVGELEREGLPIDRLEAPVVRDVLKAHRAGTIAREGIGPVLRLVCAEGLAVAEAIERSGLQHVDEGKVRDRIRETVDGRKEVIAQKGAAAASALMGVVMAEFRGRVDGKLVKRLLDEEIARVRGAAPPG